MARAEPAAPDQRKTGPFLAKSQKSAATTTIAEPGVQVPAGGRYRRRQPPSADFARIAGRSTVSELNETKKKKKSFGRGKNNTTRQHQARTQRKKTPL